MRSEEEIWKDRKEFLFKEYDAIWNVIQGGYQARDRWFKFYLIIISAVGSLILYTFSEKVGKIHEGINYLAAILLSGLFIIGVLTLMIETIYRAVITEYHNAINRIRRYFIDTLTDHDFKYYSYFLVRHTDNLKAYKKFGADLLRIYILSTMNAFVFAGILYFLLFYKTKSCSIYFISLCIFICLSIIVTQILLLKHFLTERDKKYKSQFPLTWTEMQKPRPKV
jgi:hypothetical protein